MNKVESTRAKAAEYPEGDVVRVLLEQHARVREAFTEVIEAEGEDKAHRFAELRAFLSVHETAEEMVLRPVTTMTDASVAEARNEEEAAANRMLAELEQLEVGSAAFDQLLRTFQTAVLVHAEAEEREEFPRIVEACDEAQRMVLGKALLAAEAVAPTHPHPSTAGKPLAQWAVGPVVSLVDRTRDAIAAVTKN